MKNMYSSIEIYNIPELKRIITEYVIDLEYAEYYGCVKNTVNSELKLKVYLRQHKHIPFVLFLKHDIPLNDISGFVKLLPDKILNEFINFGLRDLLYRYDMLLPINDIVYLLRSYLITYYDILLIYKDFIMINIPQLMSFIDFYTQGGQDGSISE